MNHCGDKHGAFIRRQIYGFIIGYLKEHSYPPSVREIGEGVGLRSTSTVHHHIKTMLEMGILETDAGIGSPRALRVPGIKIQLVNEETCTTMHT